MQTEKQVIHKLIQKDVLSVAHYVFIHFYLLEALFSVSLPLSFNTVGLIFFSLGTVLPNLVGPHFKQVYGKEYSLFDLFE